MIHSLKRKIKQSMFKTTVLFSLAGSLLIAQTTLAQQDTNAPTKLKPTIVTGSFIPVSEGASIASPVDIVTTAKIQEAGAADILTTLRKIDSAFTGNGNVGAELNNNSSNPGEGNIAIRNLPTLVLLDGRRLANSALSHGTAVDVFALPLGMIDRIEVLKDGSSALYGSDAVGGVVNVITKKNYDGAEVSGRYGFADEKGNTTEQRASLVGGASTETTRIVVGADYYYLDPVLAKDRFVSSATIPQLAQQQGGAGVGITPPTYFSGSFPGRVDNYVLVGSPFAQGSPYYRPGVTTPPIVGGTFTSLAAYNTAASNKFGFYPYMPIDNTLIGQSLIANGVNSRVVFNTTQYGCILRGGSRPAFGLRQHRTQCL